MTKIKYYFQDIWNALMGRGPMTRGGGGGGEEPPKPPK